MNERGIEMTPKLKRIFKDQHKLFKEKFGRDPGPNDPVFFDPDCDTPRPMPVARLTDGIIKAARAAGISPERAMRHIFPND